MAALTEHKTINQKEAKMASKTNNTWSETAEKLEILTSKPENFLKAQHAIEKDIKHVIKRFYDNVKSVEVEKPKEALPELIIENFDNEQIWQQIELQNNEKLSMFLPQISKLIAAKNRLVFPLKTSESEQLGKNDEDSLSSDEEAEDLADVDKKKHNKKETADKNFLAFDGSDSFDSDEEEEVEVNPTKKKKKKIRKAPCQPTIVDDNFFKLREMEKYLEQEEQGGSGPESDGDSVDYFADEPSSDDDEAEDPDDEEGESYGFHYKDFFDPIDGQDVEQSEESDNSQQDDSAEEDVAEEEDAGNKTKKGVRFLDSDSSDGSEDEGEADDAPKSSFETRQERLQQRIDQIHEEALGEKPWQLQGEVTATTRPQNSLLEEVLQFDVSSRPAPVITEQTTIKLEDIIRQRIKDKVWDDVERKAKPVEGPVEYKKALVLDQEKSKVSLAQLYEQDYLKKQKAAAPEDDEETQKPDEEPPEHKEIKQLMHSLFSKLDALSNYHYTPKPPAPEIKIISNLPAITVEEVAPVAASDATLLAPEEVKAKPRGGLLGTEERSSTDKKRERRKKKKMQKHRRLNQETKQRELQKQKPEQQIKMSRQQAAKHVEKATKEGSIKKMNANKKAVKSSTAFFTQLQDEVTSMIKNKANATKRKRGQESNLNIKKLKL